MHASKITRRTAFVFTAVAGVKFSAPVFGAVYDRNGGTEIVLTRSVATDGTVGKSVPRTAEVRDTWTVASDTDVRGNYASEGLPEGTVGVHYCKQTERHAEGSEWYKADVHVTEAGYTFRFVRADERTTGFCPVCSSKHSADQAARVKAADLAAAAEAEAQAKAEAKVARAAAREAKRLAAEGLAEAV